VINRLHDTFALAQSYAAAILDNAQDDQQPIPAELIVSFAADADRIIATLTTAASL